MVPPVQQPVVPTPPTQQNPATPVHRSEPELATAPEPLADKSDKQTHKGLFIGLAIGGTVLLCGAIAAAVFFSESLGIGGLFGTSGPYTDESALILGIARSVSENEQPYLFDVSAEVVFEPKDDRSKVLDMAEATEAIAELEDVGFSIPDEGHAKLNLSGIYDIRDVDSPKFAISASADVLLEPLFFKFAMDSRLAENTVYAKVTDMPELFAMFTSGVPVGEWFIVDTLDGVSQGAETFFPRSVIPGIPQVLKKGNEYFAFALPVAMSTMLQQVQNIPGTVSAVTQTAGALQAYANELSDKTSDEIVASQKMIAAIESYPVVSFVGGPRKEETDGQTIFVYPVEINHANLSGFLQETNSLVTGPSQVTSSEIEESIPAKEYIDQFNMLVDMEISVLADGTFAGYELISAVSLPGETVTSQMRSTFTVAWSVPEEEVNIEAPVAENMFSMREGRETARQKGVDNTIIQLLAQTRSSAELNYNVNSFNYVGVCDDERIAASLKQIAELTSASIQTNSASAAGMITCNANTEDYAISAPLSSTPDAAWCVDSMGTSREYAATVLTSATDITCD